MTTAATPEDAAAGNVVAHSIDVASDASRRFAWATTPPASGGGLRFSLGTPTVVLLLASLSACGIAPVTSKAAPPPTVAYVDPHGRPRAFGGGVCPVSGRHEHTWQPVPANFYVDVGGAWRDTRSIQSFTGAHPWRGRRCSISRYHQHAVAPGDLTPREFTPSSGD